MEIPREYYGWWRIIRTSQWVDEYLDDLGPAVISLTGYGDRLRMHMLLAYVNCRPTASGVSFSWQGAWEWDPMSGTGSVKLCKDGRLAGRLKIEGGDSSTFVAEGTDEPPEPIPDPPSHRSVSSWIATRPSSLQSPVHGGREMSPSGRGAGVSVTVVVAVDDGDGVSVGVADKVVVAVAVRVAISVAVVVGVGAIWRTPVLRRYSRSPRYTRCIRLRPP